VQGVVAGLHRDGRVHAFVDTGSALVHQVLAADGASWQQAGSFPAVTSVGITADTAGSLLVYGVTTGDELDRGNLALLSDRSGAWQMATSDYGHRLQGAQVLLTVTHPGSDYFLFALSGGAVHCYEGLTTLPYKWAPAGLLRIGGTVGRLLISRLHRRRRAALAALRRQRRPQRRRPAR
jgi:hypothetical protein